MKTAITITLIICVTILLFALGWGMSRIKPETTPKEACIQLGGVPIEQIQGSMNTRVLVDCKKL